MKWLRRLLILAILLLVAGGVVVWYAEYLFVPPPAPYEVTAGPVELLPPGTMIDQTAPEGWTHLIIKSRPRLASGAIDRLTESDTRYATFLIMCTVARVVPQRSALRTTYALDAVAVGVGTTVNGKDMILSPDRQQELGANLGPLFRMVLRGAYNKQQEVHLVARSPTFALLDTPALMLRPGGADHPGGQHRDVILRYALLVDYRTGHLDSLVWLIDRQDPDTLLPGPIEWLPPNKQEQAPLHVDSAEFILFGKPGPRAFAVESIPQGERRLPIPDDLKTLAGLKGFTADEALHLHQSLRQLMRSPNTP